MGKIKGSRPSSSPRRNSLGKRKPDKKEASGKKTSQLASRSHSVTVQERMLVIMGILLSVLFIIQATANM